MTYKAILFFSSILITGCAEQLKDSSILEATTTPAIKEQQILLNLSNFIDNPYQLPHYSTLSSGQASVTSGGSAGLGLPFPALLTQTLTLGATTQGSNQWGLVPVVDTDDIRRLQALLRYAIYGNSLDCKSTKAESRTPLSPFCLESDYPPFFTRGKEGGIFRIKLEESREPDSNNLQSDWLMWTGKSAFGTERPPTENAYKLGTFGTRTLYTNDFAKWNKFTLFFLDALSDPIGILYEPVITQVKKEAGSNSRRTETKSSRSIRKSSRHTERSRPYTVPLLQDSAPLGGGANIVRKQLIAPQLFVPPPLVQ